MQDIWTEFYRVCAVGTTIMLIQMPEEARSLYCLYNDDNMCIRNAFALRICETDYIARSNKKLHNSLTGNPSQ